MQLLQLLHLLLEYPYVVHERHHALCGHGAGVEPGGRQQRSHVQGHGALRRVQDEQFAPAQAQQRHLVGDLQVREERDVARPLHGAEEQARRQLADVLDAHDVGLLHGAVAEARCRVRLGSQQHGDERGQVRVAVQRVAVGKGHLGGERVLRWGDAAPLDCCWSTVIGSGGYVDEDDAMWS